jgi:hypothetical protein
MNETVEFRLRVRPCLSFSLARPSAGSPACGLQQMNLRHGRHVCRRVVYRFSAEAGDDSHTDAVSVLPLTRSDRRASGIPHSDHRDRHGSSYAVAAMTGLPSILLCRPGSLLPWLRHFPALKASVGGTKRDNKKALGKQPAPNQER